MRSCAIDSFSRERSYLNGYSHFFVGLSMATFPKEAPCRFPTRYLYQVPYCSTTCRDKAGFVFTGPSGYLGHQNVQSKYAPIRLTHALNATATDHQSPWQCGTTPVPRRRRIVLAPLPRLQPKKGSYSSDNHPARTGGASEFTRSAITHSTPFPLHDPIDLTDGLAAQSAQKDPTPTHGDHDNGGASSVRNHSSVVVFATRQRRRISGTAPAGAVRQLGRAAARSAAFEPSEWSAVVRVVRRQDGRHRGAVRGVVLVLAVLLAGAGPAPFFQQSCGHPCGNCAHRQQQTGVGGLLRGRLL
jgi:hypothetical protein